MSETTSEKEPRKERSKEEIQAEMEETRLRLAANLDQLKAETKPAVLADKAKAKVTGVFTDPETGSLRTERVAAVVAVVVGFLVLRKGLKARSRNRELEKLSQVVWVPVPKQSLSSEFTPVARVASEVAELPAAQQPLAITAA